MQKGKLNNAIKSWQKNLKEKEKYSSDLKVNWLIFFIKFQCVKFFQSRITNHDIGDNKFIFENINISNRKKTFYSFKFNQKNL